MPSDSQTQARRLQTGPVAMPVKPMPKLPPDVVKRFPSLVEWQKQMETWRRELVNLLQGSNLT